jgi:transposase
MLKMAQYDYVRIAQRVYGKKIKEIARETGHSKNTVKKILKGQYNRYKTREHQPYPVLEPYIEIIDQWLVEDRQNPKKQRHTAKRIYQRLQQEHGYKGSESTVRHYVREAKVRLGLGRQKAFIPLEPEIGSEAEVDWGTATAVIGGEEMTVKFFCMRSKYSGKHFVRSYPCERQQALFDAHIHGFTFFGGVFPVLIYDNLTTAVQKVLQGKDRHLQEAYARFQAYYTFTSRFCNPGQGHEKGGVEGLVGYVRRNYMVPIPHAESMEALNERLLKECIAHGAHRLEGRDRTVNDYFEEEKGCLLPLPATEFSNSQTLPGKADKYATVMIDKNRYSVPTWYAGLKVTVTLSVDDVNIFWQGKLAASHKRVYGVNKWSLEPSHYLELIQQRPQSFDSARPLNQWRKEWPECLEKLLEYFCQKQGHNKGVKDFISVLMLYEDHSSDDMETAVELALETKVSSSEGVRHILVYLVTESDFSPPPLETWTVLPPPDLSPYEELGGIV